LRRKSEVLFGSVRFVRTSRRGVSADRLLCIDCDGIWLTQFPGCVVLSASIHGQSSCSVTNSIEIYSHTDSYDVVSEIFLTSGL